MFNIKKNILKVTKVIVFNITFLLLILILSETLIFNSAKKSYEDFQERFNFNLGTLKYNIKPISYEEDYKRFVKEYLRRPDGTMYLNSSIILFGCSFTYGAGLKQEETFGAVLSDISKRPVYNRGIPGSGVQHMLYQLKKEDFYKEIKTEPEFVIYTLLYPYHYSRLFLYTFHLFENNLYLQYEKKNGEFVQKERKIPYFISGLYTVKYLFFLKNKRLLLRGYTNKTEDYLLSLFLESKKIVQKKYPNSKFLILNFEVSNDDEDEQNRFINKLKNNGLTVISLREISGIDYTVGEYMISKHDDHPNPKYWELVVPKLVDKLGLK